MHGAAASAFSYPLIIVQCLNTASVIGEWKKGKPASLLLGAWTLIRVSWINLIWSTWTNNTDVELLTCDD